MDIKLEEITAVSEDRRHTPVLEAFLEDSKDETHNFPSERRDADDIYTRSVASWSGLM